MYRQYPLESTETVDEAGGRRVRQVTSAPCINHHPFFLIPSYDSLQHYLYFVSWRTGRPQIFAEDHIRQCLVQLTDVKELNEWSVHPYETMVYFIADGCAMRVNVEDGREETLLNAEDCKALAGEGKINPGVTPLAPGTTAVSADGRFWAIRVAHGDSYSILVRDETTGAWAREYTGEMVSHMQFCPDDHNLLFFAGPLTDRVWLLDRTSGEARRLFTRNAAEKQWITHESWIPGRGELSLVDWPHGVIGVRVEDGQARRVTDFNAWHAIANHQGTMMVADTNFPDDGLFLFDPREEHAKPQLLCRPHASCMGAHWAGHFPYDNGPITVNAPQHTHPHPRFSPDGTHVVYTSDVTGFAQIYEITVPALTGAD